MNVPYEDGNMQVCWVVKKHPPAQDTHRSRFRWINSFALGRRLFVSLFQTTFFLLSPKNHNCSFGAKWYVLSISRHHSACIEDNFLHYFSTIHLCVLALLLSVQVASRQGNAHRTKEWSTYQVLRGYCHVCYSCWAHELSSQGQATFSRPIPELQADRLP